MLLARVKEAIVASAKTPNLVGGKLLLAEILTARADGLAGTGRHLVCLDAVGAGAGELVLAVQGSSARMAPHMQHTSSDAVIVGIIDAVRSGGNSLPPVSGQA